MPKTSRKKKQDSAQVLQNEDEVKTRGNTRENRTTGLSYRRPTGDYTRSTKWTYEINKRLYQLYKDSKPGKRGYMNRPKELWDNKYEIYNNFTAKHLAEQVRNIKKKKLLPNLDMETNELESLILHNSTETEKNNDVEPEDHNEEITTQETPENQNENTAEQPEEMNKTETEKDESPDLESMSEQELELKEKLRKIWIKNFDKYLKMDIDDREYSTKMKPGPEKVHLEILDQIVAEEIKNIEEEQEKNLWTLNVIYYTTAVTVMENEGKLRLEKRNQKVKEKPGWKIRLESCIEAIRRKISYTYVQIECNRTQKLTSH